MTDSPDEEIRPFWSTDQTCETCKGPVDIKLNEAGGWNQDPDDVTRLPAACRTCGKEHSIPIALVHQENQFEA